MDLMREFTDGFFPLAEADPPYGIDGNSHRKNKSRGKLTMSKDYHTALWDQPMPDDAYFKELFRVSKNQIIWGGNYFPQLTVPHKTPRRYQIEEWIKEHPVGWIIWDKCNGETSYNDYELAWTSFDIPTYVYSFMWNGMMQGSGIFTGHIMQGEKSKNQKRIHPTEKPIMLYKFLLQKYSTPGTINLSTHSGSASFAIACLDFGCDLVAAEIDCTHYNDSMKRINAYLGQYSIFK